MSVYTEPGLKLDFHTDGRDALLLEEIRYEAGHKGSGNWIVVTKGFGTDGVSTPRAFWPLMPPWGSKLSKAAIIHDWLLRWLLAGVPAVGFETRKAIDDEFHTALLAIGASKVQAFVAWAGVRIWSMTR